MVNAEFAVDPSLRSDGLVVFSNHAYRTPGPSRQEALVPKISLASGILFG